MLKLHLLLSCPSLLHAIEADASAEKTGVATTISNPITLKLLFF
jgi:hypothetical protein